MFTQAHRRIAAALMALAVVISNGIAPVSPAFADSNNKGTDQPVWCQFTSDTWQAVQGGSNKNRSALLMTDAIRNDARLHGVNDSVQNGQQVEEHDKSDKLDAYCLSQNGVTLPVAPTPAAPTCSASGSLSLVDTTNYTWSTSPTYTGPGTYTVSATIAKGVHDVFTDGTTTVSFKNIIVLPKQDGPQCHQPAPLVTYSAWTDTAPFVCGATSVTQTRTKTVTPYTWNGVAWVLDSAHATITTETQTRVPTTDELFRCSKPADYTTTTTKTSTVCLPGGGGTTTTWTTITKYTYLNIFNQWISIPVSSSTTEQTAEASETACPKPVQTQPTCQTTGTLTLPAYQGEWGKHYSYVVTIGLLTTTYSANKAVTITNIPQGAVVSVKLVSNDCFHTILYRKDFTFDTTNCVTPPTAPKPVDPCGPNNASWTLPADIQDIHWSIDANGNLIATAINGHFTNGQASISFGTAKDSNAPCTATPVKPQVTDCMVVLPITLGITYEVVYLDANGAIIAPGQSTIAAHQGVLATAATGYILAPTGDGGTPLDNGSYLYTVDFTGMNCGKGSTAPASTNTPATTVAAALPAPAELPHTGPSLNGLLITILATLSTYGIVYALQPKRR